jgi:MurNAc alpha-1-phosphate uridylyltransferase
MRAMILAAGRGERLRPLTDTTPKPLLEVQGKPIIVHHLERLAAAGFREVVINQGHLGDMLPAALGNGDRWGLTIHYSREPESALETGGGIFQALPTLGAAPFLVINGDIMTAFPYRRMRAVKCDWAHLVLVPDPEYKPAGDFALQGARVANRGDFMATFSGIAVYHPRLFDTCEAGRYSVVPLIRNAVEHHLVTGELYQGQWADLGTIDRLQNL